MSTKANSTICASCGHAYAVEALFCPACGTARSRHTGGDPLMGAVLGERFLILERIGHGASGTIYRGEHITLRRKVAVKVLHDELSRDELAIERFRREATMVSEIDNEHIVEIYDFGRTADGRLYLAMELLDGETLQEVLKREKRLPVDRTVDVLMQLCEALMEAHAMGYVHRDLRPRNIYLASRRGRTGFVKLLDFGLAKLVEKEGEAESTSLGMTFGEPKYMSPEQARGEALDRRADIYSLGCIAYEMLTGQPPFVGAKVFDILTRHVDSMPPELCRKRSDIPEWLDAAVMRMLAKRPADRYITVYQLVEALRHGMETGRILARAGEPVGVAGSIAALPPAGGSRAQDIEDDAATQQVSRPPAMSTGPAAVTPPPSKPAAARVAEDLRSTRLGFHLDAGGDAKTSAVQPQGKAPAAASEPPADKGRRQRRATEPSASAAHARRSADTGAKEAQSPPSRPGQAGLADTMNTPGNETAVSTPDTPAPANELDEPGGAGTTGGKAGKSVDRGLRRASDATSNAPASAAGSASLSASRSASGKRRAVGGEAEDSQAGLSAAWFADGDEAELDEKDKERLEKARYSISPGDTSLIDAEIYYSRRPMGKIAAIIGGLVLLVVVVALAWPSGHDKAKAKKPQEPARSTAASTMAALELADAAPALADAPVAAPDAGPIAASKAIEPAAAVAAEPIAPATKPAAEAAARPASSQTPGKATRTPRPDKPPAPVDELRDPFGEPDPDKTTPASPASPASEDASKADFFAKVGQQALQSGDLGSAASNFKKALELDARNADAIMGQGDIALRAGSYAAAVSHLKKAARLRPRSSLVHTLLGDAYLGSGNDKSAEASFKQALKLDPDNARARAGYNEAAGRIAPPADDE